MEMKKNCKILLVLNIILVILCGILVWKMLDYKTEVQVVQVQADERDEIKAELDSLIAEHEKMKSEYGDMNDVLLTKDSMIQNQIKEITKLMDSKVELNRLKRKMKALRRITQDYVHQIDSLVIENTALVEENTKIKEDYRSAYNKSVSLSKEKEELSEKVTNAAVLRAFNVQVDAIRMKRRGTVEDVTEKARRAEQIKVSFTLLENSLIPAGDQPIYVRIARPDESIMTKAETDQYSFMYNEEPLQFSMKEVVTYEQKNKKVTVYWSQTEEYAPGLYEVDVFSNDAHIGKGSLRLE